MTDSHDRHDQANYIERIVSALRERLDDCDDDLLRVYALLVLLRGSHTTEEDVHNAWAVWRTATNPHHRSLVPFDELAPEVQALDTKYAHAIRHIALWGDPR